MKVKISERVKEQQKKKNHFNQGNWILRRIEMNKIVIYFSHSYCLRNPWRWRRWFGTTSEGTRECEDLSRKYSQELNETHNMKWIMEIEFKIQQHEKKRSERKISQEWLFIQFVYSSIYLCMVRCCGWLKEVRFIQHLPWNRVCLYSILIKHSNEERIRYLLLLFTHP